MTEPSHATEGNLNSAAMQTADSFLHDSQASQHTHSVSLSRLWPWSAGLSDINLLLTQGECKWSQELECSLRAAGGRCVLHRAKLSLTVDASIGFHFSFANSSLPGAPSEFSLTFYWVGLPNNPQWTQKVYVCIDLLPPHKSRYPGIDSWLAGWSPCCCVLPGPTCCPQGSMAPWIKPFISTLYSCHD